MSLPIKLHEDTLQWDNGGLLIRASSDKPRIDTTKEWQEKALTEMQLRRQAKWNNR